MAKFIIKERAYFWPADIKLSHDSYAPEDITFGQISIDKKGRARAKLDGLLGGNRVNLSNPNRSCAVAGRLFDDGRYLLMLDAHNRNYAYRSNNMDRESYESFCTLLGNMHIEDLKKAAERSRRISFPLGGFEDWLFEQPVKVKRSKSRISVSYKKTPPRFFDIGADKASLSFDTYGPWRGQSQTASLTIRQKSRLEFLPADRPDAMAVMNIHRKLQELFVVLTNQQAKLDWPRIEVDKKGKFATIYYWINAKYGEEFEWHKTWIHYKKIENEFGNIINNWLNLSSSIDAGFYLYSSTRRGVFSYTENRFLSLVSGMETLHRRSKIERLSRKPHRRVAQIMRIVCEFDKANSKTRRWLREKLHHSSEPSLAQRLYDLISDLPISFEEQSLRKFTDLIGDARNDLAHYGNIVRVKSIDNKLKSLGEISNAIDILYHIRILIEIGISNEDIMDIFYKSHRGSLLLASLETAKLSVRDS